MDQQHVQPAQNGAATAKPLSCADIAKRLDRHVVSVFRCIERLGIQAVITTDGGFKFYDEAAVEIVRAAMRAPNRKRA
jgi:hypothetical protein